MPAPINLADPDFEPSDDELNGLMTRAFAGVREAKARSLVEMRARISRLQVEAMARFEARSGQRRTA